MLLQWSAWNIFPHFISKEQRENLQRLELLSRAIFGLLSTFRAAVQHVGSSSSQTPSRRELYLNVCLVQRDSHWFFFFLFGSRFCLTGFIPFFPQTVTVKNRGADTGLEPGGVRRAAPQLCESNRRASNLQAVFDLCHRNRTTVTHESGLLVTDSELWLRGQRIANLCD